MKIEYLLQSAPKEGTLPGSTIYPGGTILVWISKEIFGDDRERADRIHQSLIDLSFRSDPIYQSVEYQKPMTWGFWMNVTANKWHAVLATLSFSGGTEIFEG